MYVHIILILFSMLFYMYVYCLYNAIISISIWSCVWSSSLLDSFSYEIISLTIYAFENALCWCCRKQMGLQDIVCFYRHPADQSSCFICCCYCFFWSYFYGRQMRQTDAVHAWLGVACIMRSQYSNAKPVDLFNLLSIGAVRNS